MPSLLKTAILLGATPLLVGTSIYVAWLCTRDPHWIMPGLFTVFFGTILFLCGSVILLAHLYREHRARKTPRFRLLLQGFLVGGLLLVNFPVAMFYAGSALDLETRYRLQVFNESDRRIESLIITDHHFDYELGPILSGQSLDKNFHFSGSSTLDFICEQQDGRFEGNLEGYDYGWGGGRSLRIRSGLNYDVQWIDR